MQKVVYAKAKYNNRSPRKVRLVVDLIRGKHAERAVDILKFTNKGASMDVLKVLASAIRNATYNSELDKAKLMVVEAFVNEAPTFKRGIAVSRGRYHKILKRNSHIVIGVAEKLEDSIDIKAEKKAVKAKVETKKTVKKIDTKKTIKKKSNSKSKSNK